MANKVKFGLKNVHYAIYDAEKGTYAAPVAWPGAVSLSLDNDGDITNFAADDNAKYASFNDANGMSGDLEMAYTPDQVKIDLLGYTKDANGNISDNPDAATVRFQLLFEISSNVSNDIVVLHDCTLSDAGIDANTRSDSTDPDTDSLSLSAAIHQFDGFRCCKSRIPSSSADYATAYTKGFTPTKATE
jgi:phi13 family phage major tail protein